MKGRFFVAIRNGGQWRVVKRAQTRQDADKKYDEVELRDGADTKALMQLESSEQEPVLLRADGPHEHTDTWRRHDTAAVVV
jgi:hypothetical protein